jgi:hypothetical protein
MIDLLTRASLCLLLLASPVLAQDGAGDSASDDPAGEDHQLLVDPAFSDDPQAVVPAEPSAAERQRAVEAAKGPETARGTGAKLRGLDKITGQTREIDLASGQSVDFGRLQVSLSECRFPASDPSADAYAELTITDQRANRQVFAGWMIASTPALSALDDSRYDVWVVSCDRA